MAFSNLTDLTSYIFARAKVSKGWRLKAPLRGHSILTCSLPVVVAKKEVVA